MKVAFLTPEFPSSKTGSSGGIGTSIFNLTKGLIQQGHSVSILIYGQDQDASFEENGIVIYKIKNIKIKGLSMFLTQKKIQTLINKLFKKKIIDIIEAPDWTGITAFIKPINCPIVIRLHGSDTYFCNLENRPVKWVNKFLERRAYKNADGIISVSQFTGDLTNKIFRTNKDFDVIPNAIDIQNFNSVLVAKKLKILYFGTLIRKKGLLELPLIFNEVLKSNSAAELLLIGKDSPDIISGNKSTWLMMQSLFTKNALKNITYLGSIPYSEIKNQIELSTICIFPTFAEALPVSWLEAMAMKKPIVASNIGWAKEIIDDGIEGFLVHPKNHFEFAFKINQILKDENLQKMLGLQARKKIVKKFSFDIVARQSIQFYQQFLK